MQLDKEKLNNIKDLFNHCNRIDFNKFKTIFYEQNN